MKITPDESPAARPPDLFLARLHAGRLWKTLRRVTFLRSGLYFFLELRRALREEQAQQEVTRLLLSRNDPWYYETSSSEHERFARQTAMLDSLSGGHLFENGLEVGCSEGWYTQALAERCRSLLALDLSPHALARARNRRKWAGRVCFEQFDLRRESLPGGFDLIVIAGVLECMPNPLTIRHIRRKLVDALQTGGYLMVETTRQTGAEALLESSWWSRLLLRGKWINQFIMRHPLLRPVCSVETDGYVIDLCRKSGSDRDLRGLSRRKFTYRANSSLRP